jgi:hypothetical protein
MELDLDTFLTTVYVMVDELYTERYAPQKPRRRGHRPELADSEVLTLLLLAQWHRGRSEAAFLRYAARHWRGYCPRLLSQSAFNRRARDLMGVLADLGPRLCHLTTAALGRTAAYEVLDAVPVPLARRCRGRQHRQFADEAAIGHGGSDKQWFYGVKLAATVQPQGQISGSVAGPAATEEHWLADALFRWRPDPLAPPPSADDLAGVLGVTHRRGGRRQGPTGPLGFRQGVGEPSDGPILGDLGYRGANWRSHWWTDYGVTLLSKDDYDPLPPATRRRARRWLSGLRQQVETVFHWLDERFGLKYPRAHTRWGLATRLAAKIAAFNLAVHINYLFHRQPFEFLSVID